MEENKEISDRKLNKKNQKQQKADRLSAALRKNLSKRKHQQKERNNMTQMDEKCKIIDV